VPANLNDWCMVAAAGSCGRAAWIIWGAFDVGRKGGSDRRPGRGQPWPGPTRPPNLVWFHFAKKRSPTENCVWFACTSDMATFESMS
jgi:hypothetical protein